MVVLTLLGACGGGGDDGASPDASLPPTVTAGLVEQGAWMDDFLWGEQGWVPCTGCEHLVAYELSEGEVALQVLERTPGVPGSVTERCTATQTMTETEIDGVDPRVRTMVHYEQAAEDNTCGWADVAGDYVIEVLERDPAGNPTLIAQWLAADDPAGPFPGWDYDQLGELASAWRFCSTLPDEICEPSCDPATSDCDLPEP
jgi:hypothetical protein